MVKELSRKLAVLFLLILTINLALGSSNSTLKDQASTCLDNSKSIMLELEKANFNTQRVNDSLTKAFGLYQAQLILEQQRSNPDFTSILPYCQEILSIKTKAFQVRDEFYSSLIFYNETSNKINMSEAEVLIGKISKEIDDERYEQALILVEELNNKVIELQAQATRLNIFYNATSRGLKQFFKNNWLYFLILIIILVILYFVYKEKISKWLVTRKIKNLQLEKETLKSLVKRTQFEYFQEGKISEGTYNIRTSKFAELIRDMDRQIPLLQEELEKITHNRVPPVLSKGPVKIETKTNNQPVTEKRSLNLFSRAKSIFKKKTPPKLKIKERKTAKKALKKPKRK